MSKLSTYLVAVLLLAAGFALGHYAMPGKPQAPPEPPLPELKNPFPPMRPQTRMPERILHPSPTRSEVMEPLLEALRAPDAFARVTGLASLLSGLDGDAVPEVRAALDDYALDLGAAEFDVLVRFWATHDPEGASSWALVKSPRVYRQVAVNAAIETWAATDPTSAHQQVAAAAMMPTESSRAAELALVRGWFRSGLPGVEDYLQILGIGEARQRSIRVYTRKRIQRDGSEAAIRWAESVPDDDKKFKIDVNRNVGVELVKVDPAAAVAFCEAHCDGPLASSVRMLIAQNWADRDGLAAMEWVRTAPSGQERDWAVQGAFRGWTRSNPDEFWTWLEEMEVGEVEPWFEPVLDVMPKLLVARDPEAAIEWAGAIRDPERRERTLVILCRRWRGIDAAAANAWLEGSPLSAAARAQVLDPNPPGKKRGQAVETDPAS